MNKQKEMDYPKAFDTLMGQVFPQRTFHTHWSLMPAPMGGYITEVKSLDGKRKEMTKTMALVGRGISNALADGQELLYG